MANGSVVLCNWFGDVEVVPEEAIAGLTLGRNAARSLGVDLEWILLGSAPHGFEEVAGQQGVTTVHRVDDAALSGETPDALVEVLSQFCKVHAPRLVLFCQDFESRVVAPRLAGRLGVGVIMNGVELEAPKEGPIRITASAYGGDTRVVYEFAPSETSLVALQANAALPEATDVPSNPSFENFSAEISGQVERIRVVDPAKSVGPRLEEAEVIVSGGRGLGSSDNYKWIEELAEALGGMAGASRPIVDEGWTDSSHQVGLTGRITRPALYVAVGISGASQHMAGCGAAKNIVAINKDPDAAIFRYARYGIVGDCLEILPELVRAARTKS